MGAGASGHRNLGKSTTFTAPNQAKILNSTISLVGQLNTGDLQPGKQTVTIQLKVDEDFTVGSITVYGTLDRDTANGNGDAWEPIPAPSTEASPSWSNPLRPAVGQRLFACDKPFAAYLAMTSDDFNGTATEILMTVVA